MGGKSSPPSAPDPSAQIAAQSAANQEAVRESARVNAININNPHGSVSYDLRPDGTPETQNVTLNETAQGIFDQQQAATGQLTDKAITKIGQIPTDQFSTNGLPYNPNSYNQPLFNSWQGQSAPYDPSGANYANDANAMRNSSQMAYDQGALGVSRAGQTYDTAAQNDGYQNQFFGNAQNFRQATSDLNYDPNNYGNLSDFRGDVQNAFYNRQASLLTPQHQQDKEALVQSLADRGIPVGSEAYGDAMGNLQRNQSEQLQRVANDATLAGGAEAQRQLGMEQSLNTNAFNQRGQLAAYDNTATQGALGAHNQGFQQRNLANQQQFGMAQGANQMFGADTTQRAGFEQGLRGTVRTEGLQDHQQYANDQLSRVQAEQQLRNTALQERLLGRTQSINEASALIQGAPALGVPQAPATPNYQIAPVDVAGIQQNAYNAQVNSYNAQQQQQGNAFNTGLGVVGSMVGKCAAEYKERIRPVETGQLEKMRSMHVLKWQYKPEQLDLPDNQHVSPMAEQWHKLTGLGDGKHIHFGDYVGLLHQAVRELADKVESLEFEKRGAAFRV